MGDVQPVELLTKQGGKEEQFIRSEVDHGEVVGRRKTIDF